MTIYNGSPYYYTSSGLTSKYQFPMLNNTTYSMPLGGSTIYPYSYGIYQITCALPQVQPSIGFSPDPPYATYFNESNGTGSGDGSIWPSYWMWGVGEVNDIYGEIDGFEFSQTSIEDFQTIHCALGTAVNKIGCGLTAQSILPDGTQRTYYTLYTPDEVDWWADGVLTQSVTKYYGENDPLIGSNTYYPIYDPPISSDENNDDLFENGIFPINIPMWLKIANGVQSGALTQYFSPPISYKIQSVKYWVAGNCETPTNVTKTDIHNYNTLQFNAFTGTTVTIDGITNGGITTSDIPNVRIVPSSNDIPPAPTLGNLEAIAISSIQIKGSFSSAGYLVLKTDANMCNEYTGPYPIDDSRGPRGPIRRNGNDSNNNNKVIKQDSLALQIKNSVTKGQLSVNLTNISSDELNQPATVTVYNMLGQLLFEGKMKVLEGNTLQINLSAYSSGVYLVMVKTNSITLEKRIILEL
jgi:hypothetical protein